MNMFKLVISHNEETGVVKIQRHGNGPVEEKEFTMIDDAVSESVEWFDMKQHKNPQYIYELVMPHYTKIDSSDLSIYRYDGGKGSIWRMIGHYSAR